MIYFKCIHYKLWFNEQDFIKYQEGCFITVKSIQIYRICEVKQLVEICIKS